MDGNKRAGVTEEPANFAELEDDDEIDDEEVYDLRSPLSNKELDEGPVDGPREALDDGLVCREGPVLDRELERLDELLMDRDELEVLIEEDLTEDNFEEDDAEAWVFEETRKLVVPTMSHFPKPG